MRQLRVSSFATRRLYPPKLRLVKLLDRYGRFLDALAHLVKLISVPLRQYDDRNLRPVCKGRTEGKSEAYITDSVAE